MTDNKGLLDDLIKKNARIKNLTYMQLGIFLNMIKVGEIDWISLSEAHDYLGGYINEEEDTVIKSLISKGDGRGVDEIILNKLGEV